MAGVPPQANVNNARQIYGLEMKHPDWFFIVMGLFNGANLTQELAKFKQHVSCPTRESNTLDHCYATIKGVHHSIPRAALGLCDRCLVHIIRTYRQKLKREKPVVKTMKKYPHFCEDVCVPTVTYMTFPTNKLPFTTRLHHLRQAKEEPYWSGDWDLFNQARNTLRKEIRVAKRSYSEKPEKRFISDDQSSSDRSMDKIIDFSGGQEHQRMSRNYREKPEESELSCVSLKSDVSKDLPLNFKDGQEPSGESWATPGRVAVNIQGGMMEEELADHMWSRSGAAGRLKGRLQRKFHSVFEVVAQAGNATPLNQIYTELYITEGGTDQVNQEHEVRQIEAATRKKTRPERTIRQEDLFEASPERHRPTRSLLTKGVAGIGKTLLTQKLTLDWAEDKAHQNFHLVFPFTFRELNLLKEKKLSLVELVHLFFPEIEASELSCFDRIQVLFILDGLDECRIPLDFNSQVLTAATESTSVDVLLTNLIRGELLPSAHLWITTRPAAANQIPPECVDMVTEVRGFTDLQKEEYFRRRFRNEEQATIISHVRSSRSLYIMCHIPIFCWITATVLEDMLKSRETGELPKTLTEMYIHFLVVQAKVMKLKYHGGAGTDNIWDPESRKMIESLGKLAFEQLQRGNLIFYESDLAECGIDIKAAAVYSGVFTQIFREERGLHQDKVFCFIHLSLQEFLAALHAHLIFFSSGVNVLNLQQRLKQPRNFLKKAHMRTFYQRALNETVGSPNGHLDLFLRFLLGLSLQTSQRLLPGLVPQTGRSSWTHQDTAELIKKKISEKVSPERIINLFHCLSEVKDTSLVEEVQRQLTSKRLSTDQLSSAEWSTLAFILLSSEEDLGVFDLQKYSASETVLERLLPVVQASKEVLLSSCGLSERSGSLLSSVLSSPSSRLTQLDLSHNDLKDPGVELLSAGLKSPHCHLETLRLISCHLTERSGSHLSSVLSSPSSSLTQLDLSHNDLKDPGAELLSAGLKSPHCHLETLRLISCHLTERSGSHLSSVLSSPSSSLTQLDLSHNDLQDPGVELLSAGLKSPHCHLETLRLISCHLTERSGSHLSSVLSSPSSSLTLLDLSHNDLKDPGVELLSAGLKSPHCHLETLRLIYCGLSERSGSLLSSVLSSPSSSLTQLDLSHNDLKDPGVELLSAGLKSPHCHLETLSLSRCTISERGCASLASAMTSNPSHLRELDLRNNHPGGPGLELLSAGLESPDWRLETLRLDDCGPQRLTAGLKKYFRPPSLDPDTARRRLRLSKDNTMVELVQVDPHPNRSGQCLQVMGRDAVTGVCYWEVEWRGRVSVAVSLRRGGGKEFGKDPYSWSLSCSDDAGYIVSHDRRETVIRSSQGSHRVGVLMNLPAGTLNFYSVFAGVRLCLHTIFTSTEPLYPGFGLGGVPGSVSSVCVCDLSV
ncbi:uncharacterized protein ACB057_006388 [Neosynchiropus ocellatus]